MSDHVRRSAYLLVTLGVLFSLPVAAKTWSAHGALASLLTVLVVVLATFLGPLSFVLARTFETGFVAAVSTASDLQISYFLAMGVIASTAWLVSAFRRSSAPFPYLAVTAWGGMGAYFCVAIVFAHMAQ